MAFESKISLLNQIEKRIGSDVSFDTMPKIMSAIYSQVMRDALAMLKEQAWHLLTEDADGNIHGLPGDDGQYLMTDGNDIWIDDYVDGVDDGVWLDSGRDIREIKAWMYMPEPPKQEGW